MIRQEADLLPLWDHLSEHLIRVYGNEFFRSWLQPLKIKNIEDGVLILHAPNYLVMSRVHSTYLSEMLGAIKRMPEYADLIDSITLRLISSIKTPYQEESPKYSFENFLAGESNEFAKEVMWKIMEKNVNPPFPFVYLQGEIGCGKTHLMKALENFLNRNSRKKVKYVPAESFVRSFVKCSKEKKDFQEAFEHLNLLILDDVERFKNKKASQEALLQVINNLTHRNRVVMVSSHLLPTHIEGIDSRLLSHFNSGVMAQIGKPDMKLRKKIVHRASQESEGQMSKEVIEFISSELETNVRELLGACNRIICRQKFLGKSLTVTQIKDLLKDLLVEKDSYSNSSLISEIISIVEDEFMIPKNEILKKRAGNLAKKAKYALAYVITQKAGLTYEHVKQCFSEKEVMGTQAMRYAVREARKLSRDDRDFCQKMLRIERRISKLQKENGI